MYVPCHVFTPARKAILLWDEALGTVIVTADRDFQSTYFTVVLSVLLYLYKRNQNSPNTNPPLLSAFGML